MTAKPKENGLSKPLATGWTTDRFDSFCVLQRGFDITKKDQKEGSVPVVSSGGVSSYHDEAKVRGPGVVIGRKGTLGTVHYIDCDYWPHDTTLWVKDFKGNDPRFTSYLLQSLKLKRFDTGAANPTLNRNLVHGEEVTYPSLPEQKKIAHILSTVQRAIEDQERIIQTTTELKKALMHKAFTEGLRNEPQKQTEIGPMPTSWEVVKLGELFETQLGKMLSQKARTGSDPKPYLRNKNVQWREIDTTDLLLMDFDRREEAKFTLLSGDLLVCEGGQPGRAAIWRGQMEQCYYQKALHRLRPKNNKITNDFLLHWLEFSIRYQNTYKLAGASTIAHLPEVQLKALPIPLPTADEQAAIVETLDRLDTKEGHHLRKRDLFQDLFRTLLRDLMTAKARVPGMESSSSTTSLPANERKTK